MANPMIVCGVLDESISTALRAWVKQGDRMVCGIIGPGTSRTLTSKWDSPLENSNLGSNISDKLAGATQALKGTTSITIFSSTQVWQGNMPLKFSLNLIFIAQSNAYEEVMKPLQWLEEFASGEVNGTIPVNMDAIKKMFSGGGDNVLGRIPGTVTINIGRKIIVPNCVIENITVPLDKERTGDGNLIRAEVQLDIQTKVMLNKSSIGNTWTGTDKLWSKLLLDSAGG